MKSLLIIATLLFVAAISCESSATPPQAVTSTPTTAPAGIGPVLQVPGQNVATPDFTLPSADGGSLQFADYRGKQPVVVVFYRGFF